MTAVLVAVAVICVLLAGASLRGVARVRAGGRLPARAASQPARTRAHPAHPGHRPHGPRLAADRHPQHLAAGRHHARQRDRARDALAYFRVVDPDASVVCVENAVMATSQIAQTTLRSVLGNSGSRRAAQRARAAQRGSPADHRRADRAVGNQRSRRSRSRTSASRARCSAAMARQAEEERERGAKIMHAEASTRPPPSFAGGPDPEPDPGVDAAPVPADALRARRRAGLDDRVLAAARPHPAAAGATGSAPAASGAGRAGPRTGR